MSLSQSLQLKQQQSLVMTPQLQQAIKLLQLSRIELDNSFSLALPESERYDNSLVTEWTAKLQAQFDQLRGAHVQQNVAHVGCRRRPAQAAAAAAADQEEEEVERPARRHRRENA